MLKTCYMNGVLEAGCDEAGRGCLAGPVFAAAVILNDNIIIENLDDSKKLSEKVRNKLKAEIEEKSLAWAVCKVDNVEIDRINILNASILAMFKALDNLNIIPQHIIVDGNRFKKYNDIPHKCIVRGDAQYASIAAASILAKTHRDEYMQKIHNEFPQYGWYKNKGYPTKFHREAIYKFGISPYHLRSFNIYNQLRIEF